MICRAATKVNINRGIAIRLPMAMTLPQSTSNANYANPIAAQRLVSQNPAYSADRAGFI